ncbi:hypothetical protein [Methylobacterium hispanicum]|uniref:hypothetical protein n=1 Tax=Methylobacterium hispanicum TaxID=270350 RepID=UPI002F2DD659
MTAPTLFTSPFALHRAAILASPALLQLVLNLHDALAHSLDPSLAACMTDVQRAIGTELITSHACYGDADAGFVLLATTAETALANVEREYGAIDWAALTG